MSLLAFGSVEVCSAITALLLSVGWRRGGMLIFPHRVYPWGPRTKKSPLVLHRCPTRTVVDFSGGYRDDAATGQCPYSVRAHAVRGSGLSFHRCPTHHCNLVKV